MIDFATLQGLTIPEGVVTQITDASGRVLWSAAPAFDGFIYLRPSADIFVDSSIALTPSTATAAYMLINVEVSDGAATTIGVTASTDATYVTGEAQFSLGGDVPKQIPTVTDIYVDVSASVPDSGDYEDPAASLQISVFINGSTYLMLPPNADAMHNGFEGVSFGDSQECRNAYETPQMCAIINEYVAANGVLPNIDLRIKFSNTHTHYLRQTYQCLMVGRALYSNVTL